MGTPKKIHGYTPGNVERAEKLRKSIKTAAQYATLLLLGGNFLPLNWDLRFSNCAATRYIFMEQ